MASGHDKENEAQYDPNAGQVTPKSLPKILAGVAGQLFGMALEVRRHSGRAAVARDDLLSTVLI